MTFAYKAVDEKGRSSSGRLDASSRSQAVDLLRDQGLTPFEIEPVAEMPSATTKEGLKHFRFHSVSRSAVAGMARQMATLLQAGLPLDEVLAALCAKDDHSRLTEIIASVREHIMAGGDLASGLAAFPKVFSSTFVNMVRAGEVSGTLEIVMERFATHSEQQVALQRKLQATLAYPALMLVAGTGVVIFLLTFVVPKLTGIFTDLGRELPLPTKILLAISDTIRNGWWLIPLIIAAIAFIVWRIGKSPVGKTRLQKKILQCPGLRGVCQPLLLGRMTRTLGMLLKNGVPLLKALQIVKAASGSLLMDHAVQSMIDGVQAGRDLSQFMDDPLLFPPLAKRMVLAGERSGQIGEMLLWVAGDCEKQLAARLQVLTALMEPMIILLLGGITGFVVIAIMLPIFEMSNLAG